MLKIESENASELVLSNIERWVRIQQAIWAAIAIVLVAVTVHQILLFPEPRFTVMDRAIGAILVLSCALVASYMALSTGVERFVVDKKKRTITKSDDAVLNKNTWSVSFDQIDHIQLQDLSLLTDSYSLHIVCVDGTRLSLSFFHHSGLSTMLWGWSWKKKDKDIAKKLASISGKPLIADK
ncbi:hypothetical protein HYV43_00105 [Candidatus Micrarchaeota archaeon]|nr:hypothetical protein [Candidatus Micrarchaeota archaeon]